MPVTPILILDSKEQWRPVPVEDCCALYGFTFAGSTWKLDGTDVNKINFPPTMAPGDFSGMPNVAYHRIARGGGLHWHQFWTWWPYNPKVYAGVGKHEGDWEMVQLGCVDEEGNRPVLMTLSQHSGGERREYWRVELNNQKQPLVYIARDSHANYFGKMRDVTDTADGRGTKVEPTLLPFGDWESWQGKWGNSDNSPGPLSSRRAWKAPHAYHSQARG